MRNARLHHDLEDAYEELKKAQRKLGQLEQLRALGDLAADMVHAMGHYMGIISGRAEMFLSFGKDPEKNMQAVLETAEEGKEVIERIRASTRLGVGKERVAASLADLVRQSVEDIQALWAERTGGSGPAVKWQTDLEEFPETYLNPTDVKEALNNLLLNALEAMPEGGTLTVSSLQRGDDIGFRVTDTGTGIDDEVRARILEPFFSTKEDVGTGLGLSIISSSKTTAAIWRSTARRDREAASRCTCPWSPPHPPSRRNRISMSNQVLIVENAREYREMLQEIDEGIGHDAHSAQKATEAWKLIQKEIFSLIRLGIKMPGIHGHQFLRYIRKQGTRIPVIVVSGYLSPEVLEVLKVFDVSQVIVKPFKVMRLAQGVNKVLEAA